MFMISHNRETAVNVDHIRKIEIAKVFTEENSKRYRAVAVLSDCTGSKEVILNESENKDEIRQYILNTVKRINYAESRLVKGLV